MMLIFKIIFVFIGILLALFAIIICLNNAKRKKLEYRLRINDYIQKYGCKPTPEGFEED
jgi:hypothetical protein